LSLSARNSWLLERLSQFADRDAIVDGEQTLTYLQLGERVEAWRQVLEQRHLKAGSVVAVRGDYSPAICSLLLAVVFQRSVVVTLPVDGDPRPHLETAHAQAFFDFVEGDGWSYWAPPPAPPPPLLQRLRDRAAAGLVVFTSGTTGHGKAALFDFDTLVERYRPVRRGHRTLVFLMLDHLGGIHTMLHTLAHGGALLIGRARRPDDVARAIERHRAELLPTTPTFLRMLVISRAHERHDLSSLRLITYGTEPMPASTLEALKRAFPGVGLKQTYGLTELGVLPTRSRESGSLWLELGGLGCQARVVDGVLWVRSDTAMLGYLNAPSPFDEDGWYNTHDAVEVDGPYVRILGRTTELINVGGQKVYPSEVESTLLEIDNITEATVWGEANPVTGQVVAARVTLARAEDQESLERRIDRFCRGRLAVYKIPVVVEIVQGDHHGQRFKKVRPAAPTIPALGPLAPA
jgi:acyl-CoA synthetase (AMP-forming)/AMP-acid ligase II